MTDRVTVHEEGAVAHVELTRAEKRNGLDLAMMEAIVETGTALGARNDIRAIVLSGAGHGFCAGLDWAAFMADPDSGQKLLRRPEGEAANIAQAVGWVWQRAPMPVIAAVHGFAFGGGLQLALGADLIYATADAQLSVMEMRYGLIPDMGLTQTLLPRVGLDVAKELTFTARRFSGEEGRALGVVTKVASDPVAEAMETARQIAARSPQAMRAAKRLFREAPGKDPHASFRLETDLQLELLGSPNQMEAAMAVMQKREPSFRDPE